MSITATLVLLLQLAPGQVPLDSPTIEQTSFADPVPVITPAPAPIPAPANAQPVEVQPAQPVEVQPAQPVEVHPAQPVESHPVESYPADNAPVQQACPVGKSCSPSCAPGCTDTACDGRSCHSGHSSCLFGSRRDNCDNCDECFSAGGCPECYEQPGCRNCWCKTPGNLYMHYAYMPEHHGYYYFRPYNYVNVQRDLGLITQMGGHPHAPYSTTFLETNYTNFADQAYVLENVHVPRVPVRASKNPVPNLEDLLD